MELIRKRIIIDTGFWFALYRENDQHHKEATRYVNQVINAIIIIPHPTLYEIINTRFLKNIAAVKGFEAILNNPSTIRIDDSKYKHEALKETFLKSGIGKFEISFVDMIIRHMILDVNNNIDYLLTFNKGDFAQVLKTRPKTQFYYGQ